MKPSYAKWHNLEGHVVAGVICTLFLIILQIGGESLVWFALLLKKGEHRTSHPAVED